MTYGQTLEWLFSQLPMFQRVGGAAYKADLENTHKLMHLLDNPEKGLKAVHVAGTNGKGSVSHSLAAVFQKAGFKTGLYTSPHLKDFRERIRINGQMIPEQAVVDFVEMYREKFQSIDLSFFEMTVGMAFDYFRQEKVDIAIIEVGMGGRLDSTNVLTPELSIITNISLDHTQFLGTTLSAIAGEKAGIIKANVPVLIGERHQETTSVFTNKAKILNSSISFAEDMSFDFSLDNFSLKGSYQKKNLQTILSAIDILEAQGYPLKAHYKTALKNVQKLTGLRGRWEVLQKAPLTICDTGHNEAGIKDVVEQLSSLTYKNLHVVWGMAGDKDANTILALLPKSAVYYWCTPFIPRAKEAEELQTQAKNFSLFGETFSSPQLALTSAKAKANKEDVIFIGGSTFTVADIL